MGRRKPKIWKVCQWCGERWLTSQYDALYHSDRCRVYAHRSGGSKQAVNAKIVTARAVTDREAGHGA